VLQGGHAACILVKHVEKPTDNRAAPSLCCRVVDADSLKKRSAVVGPGAFPTTLPVLGSMTILAGNKEFNTTTNG